MGRARSQPRAGAGAGGGVDSSSRGTGACPRERWPRPRPPGLRKWTEDAKVKVPSAVLTPEAWPGRLGTHCRVLTSGSRPHPHGWGWAPPVGGTNACPAPLTCPTVLFPEHSDCTDLDSGAMGHELSDRGPVAFLACLGLAAGLALLVYCCPADPKVLPGARRVLGFSPVIVDRHVSRFLLAFLTDAPGAL
uniref:caspase recruitment domain-containing protein 19 isoform X2 n=1 Tax=Nyctereutes procyonoides TaxID=34880 RepID=UPI002443DA28|nr:caspase recruitment domain-containing protein 19 isoform X2 [Nyctereutes procyonoides]